MTISTKTHYQCFNSSHRIQLHGARE